MRALLLLPFLALFAAPQPAAAQSPYQAFCVANDHPSNTRFRAKITQIGANGAESAGDWRMVLTRSHHCEQFPRPAAVRIVVQHFGLEGWVTPPACDRTITQPRWGAMMRPTGTVTALTCVLE